MNASDEDQHDAGQDKNEEAISDLFEGVMRPYQIDGFRWLVVILLIANKSNCKKYQKIDVNHL